MLKIFYFVIPTSVLLRPSRNDDVGNEIDRRFFKGS